MGAEGILRDLFGLYSTFDKTSLKMNEAYKNLLKKKTNGGLSDNERKAFAKLSEQLSHIRLDPTLDIVQEDAITKLVREKLNQRSQNTAQRDIKLPDDLPQQVESILDNFFKTPS